MSSGLPAGACAWFTVTVGVATGGAASSLPPHAAAIAAHTARTGTNERRRLFKMGESYRISEGRAIVAMLKFAHGTGSAGPRRDQRADRIDRGRGRHGESRQ